jgi:predicted MFS family arabinose efflux permease
MQRRVLAVLVLGGMCAAANVQIFALLLTSIADDFDTTVAFLGSLRMIESTAAIAGGLLITRLADKIVRKWLLIAGYALMLGAALAAIVANSSAALTIYFVLAGLASVTLFSSILAAPSDFLEDGALDRANGFVIGSFSLPGIVIVPLAGVLSEAYGWRTAYLLNVSLATLAILGTLLFLPRAQPQGHQAETMLGHLRVLSRQPGFILILLANFVRFVLFTMALVFTASFLIERYDLSDDRAGLYYGVGSGCFLVVALLSGFLLNRFGIARLLIRGGYVISITFALAMGPSWPLLVTGLLLIFSDCMLAIHENGALGTLLRMAPNARGSAAALNELGAGAGGLVGAGLGGLVLNLSGYSGLGICMGLLSLGATLLTRAALNASQRPIDAPPAKVVVSS